MIYEITNIVQGTGKQERRIYASLIDDKGDVRISATLDYILHQVVRQKFEVSNLLEGIDCLCDHYSNYIDELEK